MICSEIGASQAQFTLSIFYMFDPCGRYGRFNSVKDRSEWSTSNRNGKIGPICDTTKSTVAATGHTSFKRWFPVKRIEIDGLLL